jgi:hypothetical protein
MFVISMVLGIGVGVLAAFYYSRLLSVDSKKELKRLEDLGDFKEEALFFVREVDSLLNNIDVACKGIDDPKIQNVFDNTKVGYKLVKRIQKYAKI